MKAVHASMQAGWRALRVIVSALAVIGAYFLFFWFGPSIETRFFPVFSYFRIIDAVEIAPNEIRVRVAFEKMRQCAPAGYGWYIGRRDSGDFEEIDVDALGSANAVRPEGRQISRPFVLHMSAADLESGAVFANVFSRCHQLWLSRTEVYPDPNSAQIIVVSKP